MDEMIKYESNNKYALSLAKRRYKIDETLFEKIDTEFKAYFLGWMYSDGSVYIGARRHTLSITVSEKDKEILDIFNTVLYENKKSLNYRKSKLKITPKKTYKCKPCYRLQIDSKKMCDDIQKLGCLPNKSKTIQFPSLVVPKILMRHFIRGYFDGDGCITTNRAKWGSLKIFSSQFFCEKLAEFLKGELNILCSIRENTGCWSISFCKRNYLRQVYDYFYTDSSYSLVRKKSKFELILNNLK